MLMVLLHLNVVVVVMMRLLRKLLALRRCKDLVLRSTVTLRGAVVVVLSTSHLLWWGKRRGYARLGARWYHLWDRIESAARKHVVGLRMVVVVLMLNHVLLVMMLNHVFCGSSGVSRLQHLRRRVHWRRLCRVGMMTRSLWHWLKVMTALIIIRVIIATTVHPLLFQQRTELRNLVQIGLGTRIRQRLARRRRTLHHLQHVRHGS
mmetsp:Transcript_93034/g.139637  ORF Transcript_93034/g.139637 Transcript_93034/m.139637 type:complete len:205 (+) Transcript_93034:441-1055(+)